jgi:Adenine specific DNA methylase Mod
MNKYDKYINYTKEELIDELESLKKKKYGLVWDKKNSQELIDAYVNWENVPENFSPNKFPVLKELKNKEILTNKINPINLLIEGDNYHALAVLNFTHKSKIDFIYIDPPYNIGNNDFIFNDKFVDKEDPWRHSKWLTFMEKRLRLAKSLLTKTGSIFISIDDNEFAQLKLLCDEIFGESNFYGCLTWVKRTKSTNSGKAKKMIQQKVEYILIYGKQSSQSFQGFNLLFSGKKKQYPDDGKFGECRFENLEATDYGRKKRNTMKFQILGVEPRPGRRWQIGEETAKKLVSEGKIELVNNFPMRAFYPEDEEGESFIPFWSHLENTGTAETGKQELSDIIGPDHGFDTVKPLPLIKLLLNRFDNNIIVLDFFAGSGTTAQAVLELNNTDGGVRRFILCTNNENNICTDICFPRLGKLIKGYKNNKGESKEGLSSNLKYYKNDFVGAQPTDRNKRDLVNNSAEMICMREDFFDLIEDKGLNFRIYKKDNKYLGIVFDEDSINDFKKTANKLNGEFIIYCFSYNETPPEKEFEDFKNKHKLEPIPEIILKVYREIFKK